MTADRNPSDPRNDAAESARESPGEGDWPAAAAPDDADAWLTRYPDVFGDHGDLPRLRELWQSAPPVEPAAAVWTATLARIETAVPGRPRNYGRRWTRWAGGMTMSAAAAALLAVLLGRVLWEDLPNPPQLPPVPVAEAAFAVAEADDVHIVSMDPRDAGALVVGEPPVADEIVFAAPADIKVIKVEPCPVSGRRASLVNGDVPMLFTTVARAGGEDE